VSSEVKVVLDASAIVALIMKERGHEVISQIVRAGVAATTPTGLAEALAVCRRKGHGRSRDELAGDLAALGLTVESVEESDGVEMAFLLAKSDDLPSGVGSLSLGDAACLAVAHRLGVPAVMSDAICKQLQGPGLTIQPFR
jgi:PIN domain nuclease of toxin-antitoxin system